MKWTLDNFNFMHNILSCEYVMQFKGHPYARGGSKSFPRVGSSGKGGYDFIL